MESYSELYPAKRYHHSPYDAAEMRNSHILDNGMDCWENGPESIKNPIIPIQRYLNERNRPLFMPSILEIDAHAMGALPDVLLYGLHHAETNTCDWSHQYRLTSPTISAIDSSYVSSEWSGHRQSPLASPQLDSRSHSPQHNFNEGFAYAYGGHPPVERLDSHSPDACVALHEVQICADELPDTVTLSSETIAYSAYGSFAQEGYQPLQTGDETTSVESYSTPEMDERRDAEETGGRQEPASPVIRRRRAQSSRSPSINTQVSLGRISRRPNGSRRTSHRSTTDDSNVTCVTGGNRAFPCPLAIYGCASTFGSKNEWKRHVSTQHMRLGYWRCDQCPCNGGERNKPNDFNRKDLFVQHVRRMHPLDTSSTCNVKKSKLKKEKTEEQHMQDAASRCYRRLRSPPEKSQCVFCEQHFHGTGSWDERMEHIGRHMENVKKDCAEVKDLVDWCHDEDAERWFVKQQVVVIEGERLVLSA